MRADDPALDDGAATQLAWYHTSTHLDWPPTIDFAGSLNGHVRQMMGGDAVDRWAHRQATKALHIGTYESAIHNMLRRIRNQSDHGKQFYLYRVHLNLDAVIRPGWITDPSDFFGDVHLDEFGPPEVEAVRYVNFHEDPGGLSVAIRPSAIRAKQRLAIPLPIDDDPWIVDAVARLSSDPPDQPREPELPIRRLVQFRQSPRAKTAAAASNVLADRLPINLRDEFETATRWHSDSEPTEWARYAAALAALIENPARVLVELDAQVTREH